MSERIDETLKRIAAATSKENSPTSSSTDDPAAAGRADLLGDPECPHCAGLGYLRADVPIGHQDFGKILTCTCRQAQVSQQVHRRLYSLSNLDELSHLTFDNFELRGRFGQNNYQADSIELAYNQSHQFSQSMQGWLLLEGHYGSGKTHLAAAIANFVVGLGVPTLFLTVPDLLDTLRFSYDDPETSFEQRFEEIRQISLLILDDFGTQNATPWAQEKLFQIVNYRYINRLPLVVTTNLALEEIEGRIRSRLLDPELVTRVEIIAPDYRQPLGDTGSPTRSSLDTLNGLTFGNYSDRRGEGLSPQDLQSLEKAFRAALDFAENPNGWLVFTGPYGCGKTHLAAAIGNYRNEKGQPPIFVTSIELLDHLRATFNPESNIRFDRQFKEFQTCAFLILDDLGTESMTPWVKERIDQLFNARYNAKLPTVITTSKRFDEIDDRIRSRMLDKRLCRIFGITAPSYHGTKPGQSKSSRKQRT
ncbi:MAG TPA: ATP-binding protein [Anaerolineales bacterium]|jgi:DNA replication protein DnaC|nr:ATP-binding protein [Anaerolineales bacterium]